MDVTGLEHINYDQTVKSRKKAKETTRQHTERILQYADKIIPATNNLLETVANCSTAAAADDDDDHDDNDDEDTGGKHRDADRKKRINRKQPKATKEEQESKKQRGQVILNEFYDKYPQMRPKPHTPELNNLSEPPIVNVSECPSDVSYANENNKSSELPIVNVTECLSEVSYASENNKSWDLPIVNVTEHPSQMSGVSGNSSKLPRVAKRVIEEEHDEVSGHVASSRRRIRSERRVDSIKECSCGCGTMTTTYQLCPTANYKSKCPYNNVISTECCKTGWVCCIDCKKTNKGNIQKRGEDTNKATIINDK